MHRKNVIKGFARFVRDRHVGSRFRLGTRRWRPLGGREANQQRERRGYCSQFSGGKIVKREADYTGRNNKLSSTLNVVVFRANTERDLQIRRPHKIDPPPSFATYAPLVTEREMVKERGRI